MRSSTKVAAAALIVAFGFLAAMVFHSSHGPVRNKIRVEASGSNVTVTFCQLTVGTNRFPVYLSRGRRVSRLYHQAEGLIRLPSVTEVCPAHGKASGPRLIVALRMPPKQLGHALHFTLTDATGARMTSELAGGGCISRDEDIIILDWNLTQSAMKMKLPLRISIRDEKSATLAFLTAEW